MRILLTIVHFFRGEENPRYMSVDASRRDERANVLQNVIDSWRGHMGPATQANQHLKKYERILGAEDALDIAVLVRGDDHLLDPDFCSSRNVNKIVAQIENPRMLGFAAHRLFADHRYNYDMFIYSEDDLKILDGGLISRILGFQEELGYRRILLPNRFEWNLNGPTLKTYIDGDVPPRDVKPYVDILPDEEFLHHRLPGRRIVCRRAVNPHSGFFAMTSQQLAHWITQPHFGDFDCSFMTPLESAATLGLLKTFSIYKPFGRDSGWLELQHLDNRYSGGIFPS